MAPVFPEENPCSGGDGVQWKRDLLDRKEPPGRSFGKKRRGRETKVGKRVNQIFVFSGTGNTWHLAKRTAHFLGDGEIAPVAGFRHDATVLAQGDTVGIATPVYAGGLPALVKDFLAKLVLRRHAWSYLLLTHGGLPFGAGRQGARLLARQGVALDAIFSVEMPDNFPSRLVGLFAWRRGTLLAREDGRAEAVAASVRERRRERSGEHFPWVTELLHDRLLARFRRPAFWADGHCGGCGICREVCPVENIVMDGMHRPQWLGPCEGCGACYSWCPSRAIQVGRFSWGILRYHHPDVSLDEMRSSFRKIPLHRVSLGAEER